MSKTKQLRPKEIKFLLLDLSSLLSITPMIILAAIGMMYLIGVHSADVYGINCATTSNPQECQSQIDSSWRIYEAMPYYLLGFVIFIILKLTGALEEIMRRKTCVQCNAKTARNILGKNNEEYVDCKNCGIYPKVSPT